MRTYRCQVLVVGLGVMGSACADALARRGLSVLGVEQDSTLGGRGASFGGSRLLREHPDRPALTAAVRDAAAQWSRLEHDAGRRLFVRTGGVTVGTMPGDAAGHRMLHPAELRRMLPGMRIEADESGWYEPHAGILLAEDCVDALRARAVEHGATLRFGIEAQPDSVGSDTEGPLRVRVADEIVEPDLLVLATGAWAAVSGLRAMPKLTVEQAVMHWLDDPVPAPEPFVIFDRDPTPFGVFPAVAGQAVKFGRFSTGMLVDPRSADAVVPPDVVTADIAALRARMSGVSSSPAVRSRVCRYTHTAGGALTLARITHSATAVCACSGMGFKFAPVIGQAVADVLLDGRTSYATGALTVSDPD